VVVRSIQHEPGAIDTGLRRPSRRARFIGAALILGTFGPYIAGPVRTEQLVVYGIALATVFTLLRLKAWTIGLLAPWLWMVGVATAATFLTYQGALPWDRAKVLSGYDNLLLPIAIMLIIWTLLPATSYALALRTVAKTLAWASAANAVLSVISSMIPTAILPLIRPFWSEETGAVAESAMQMGRFTGVINQPAEAGVVYSIAAILAVWAYSNRAVLMYALLALITIGGMLSVSKVFLLIGLPVVLALLWMTRRGTERLWMVGFLVVFVIYTLTSTFIQEWSGYDYMMRLLEIPPGDSIIEFYTAGRWDEDANMRVVLDVVLAASPLAGVGASGLEVPYDSQWTETLIMSGLLGIFALVVVFLVMLLWFRRIADWETRWTAYALWAVLFFGSFGISTLTANRVSTIAWVVVALLVALAAQGTPRPQHVEEPVAASDRDQ